MEKSKNFAAKCLGEAILSAAGALSKFHPALPLTPETGRERACWVVVAAEPQWSLRELEGSQAASGRMWLQGHTRMGLGELPQGGGDASSDSPGRSR